MLLGALHAIEENATLRGTAFWYGEADNAMWRREWVLEVCLVCQVQSDLHAPRVLAGTDATRIDWDLDIVQETERKNEKPFQLQSCGNI